MLRMRAERPESFLALSMRMRLGPVYGQPFFSTAMSGAHPPHPGVRFSPLRSSTRNLGRHAQLVSSLMRNYFLASGVVISNHIGAVVDTKRPPLPLVTRAVPPRLSKWFQRAKGGWPRTQVFRALEAPQVGPLADTAHPHTPPRGVCVACACAMSALASRGSRAAASNDHARRLLKDPSAVFPAHIYINATTHTCTEHTSYFTLPQEEVARS